jgi:hypothetical protein
MATGAQTTGRPRRATAGRGDDVHIHIVDNPLQRQDPQLAAQVEAALRQALAQEGLGSVQVRFRICRDDDDAVRFICKVENPPRVDGDGAPPPWRWWSPLLETAQDFRRSLDEGLRVRRQRLVLAGAGPR